MLKKILTLVLFLLPFAVQVRAQDAGGAVEHMSYLADREELLRKKYLSYMSEVAHGERARKMEKRREELISTIKEAITDAGRLRPYKGDATLKSAFLEYWNILLLIFKEDYHKIVDMEEVAEQSYDMMEAFLLAQEKVDLKLEQAYGKVPPAYQAFASKHGVVLNEGQKSKLATKLEQVGKVNNYVNQLYLIYFKSAVQEMNLMNSLKANDINGVEQTKNALLKFAAEGLQRLDTVKAYKGDGSLITACRKVLEFHRLEADKKIPSMSDFLIKSDEFNKLKKSFESKPAGQRTKEDVDKYNNAVNEMNKAGQLYNKNADELFAGRNKVLTNWDQTKRRFMDSHIPYK